MHNVDSSRPAADSTIGVGQRLKELRERAGVSQREVSRKSGMSPASISAIELGKVSPSVETLKRILDCLGETMANFFAVGLSPRSMNFFGPEDLVEVSLDKIHYLQLPGTMSKDGLQFVKARVNPGSDTRTVTHQYYDSEIGFVLKGRIEVTISGETRVLGRGEGYIMRGSKQIRIRNIFKEDCEYVFVSSTAGMLPQPVPKSSEQKTRHRQK